MKDYLTLNEFDKRTNIKTKFIMLKKNITQCTRYWDIDPFTNESVHYRINNNNNNYYYYYQNNNMMYIANTWYSLPPYKVLDTFVQHLFLQQMSLWGHLHLTCK